MKFVPKMIAIIVVLISISCIFNTTSYGEVKNTSTQMISEWQIKWTLEDNLTARESTLEQAEGWIDSNSKQPLPTKPNPNSSAWFKIQLPEMNLHTPTLLIKTIYGRHIMVRTSDTILYESQRTYNYEQNKIMIPLRTIDSNSVLFIGVSGDKQRIGFHNQIVLGNNSELLPMFVKKNLLDMILGSSFIFVSFVMLICSLFLRKIFLSNWITLSIVILTIGILMITYSSYLYSIDGGHGELYTTLFDCALFILLPSLTYFFEGIFGVGYYGVIRHFRRFQVGYSTLCCLCMFLNSMISDEYVGLYYFISVKILGSVIIFQCVLLVITSILYAMKGNKDAAILSIGLVLFVGTSLLEMIYFYSESENYDFFAWKWGAVSFVTVLIIIIGRRFAINHDQVVTYSKELELFNNELQRSEKIEIIGELAASVAHEVRNPLQVTRGFLQLLTKKYEQEKQQEYLNLALEELDRASNIITDFLTFAKPELDHISVLNIRDELIHIEGILLPLANLSGGEITVNIPRNLMIRGNSSKFKQALINIIKNSIESWHQEGHIKIWAYRDSSIIVIHIQDNGEGMNEEELTRLGEPYFSNKTKGTGLGLMVTFRIIEVMHGKIHFISQKGVGTETIITFPSISE